MEIATIFGKARMEKCARVHSRTLLSNVPAIDHAGHSLEAIILKTNPDLWTPHESDPDPDNHKPTIALSLDFLKQTLQLDPCKRITASQALRHPFLQREGVDEDEDGPCRPEEAVCGRWHQMNEDGSSRECDVSGFLNGLGTDSLLCSKQTSSQSAVACTKWRLARASPLARTVCVAPFSPCPTLL